MEILKIILHVLDTERNVFVPSDLEIDQMNEDIAPIVEGKLRKVFASPNKKQAYFQNSLIEKWIRDYKTQVIDFQELSDNIASHIFEEKRKYNIFHSSDFILCEVKFDDVRYLVGLDNTNNVGMTHQTQSIDGQVKNEVILYKTLFSSNLVKNDRVFIVEYANSNLQLIENPYVFQTHKVNVFQEILQCSAKPSYKETVQTLTECVEVLTEKYALDEYQTIPKLKTMIKDSVIDDQVIHMNEIADVVFDNNDLAKNEFKHEISQAGIQESVIVENVRPSKQDRTQKIKCDNGIEIIVPVDLMNSKDQIEFINEADGRISIQLKNIQTLERK